MNGHKLISDLMKEYNVEIDDIRWYLASLLKEKLVLMGRENTELEKYIWSGKLDSDLYNMEEKFLDELKQAYDSGTTDEAYIREKFAEISASKCSRF